MTVKTEFRETWPFFAVVSVVLGVGAWRSLPLLDSTGGRALFLAMAIALGLLYWLAPFLVESRKGLIVYCLVQGALTLGIGLTSPVQWLVLSLYGALLGITAAAFWPGWRSALTAAALCVALMLVNVVSVGGWQALLELLPAIGLMSVFVCVYVLLFVRQLTARLEAQELLAELGLAHRRLQESSERVEELTLDRERQRMSRELHDTLAQGLAGLILQLEAADGHLEEDRTERAREVVQRALERTRSTLREARRAILALRPSSLEKEGLVGAVRQEVELYRGSTGRGCRLTVSPESIEPDPEVAQQLLRILQESLSNVVRHAEAQTTEIRLEQRDDRLELEIRDDGRGFDPSLDTTGLGLEGMRERAARVGGELQVESRPHEGTRVRLEVPA